MNSNVMILMILSVFIVIYNVTENGMYFALISRGDGLNFINTYNSGDYDDLLPDCFDLLFTWKGQFPQQDNLTGHFIGQKGTSHAGNYDDNVKTAMHEIRHTLGCIHADMDPNETWTPNGCLSPISAINSMPCLPSNESNSIMQSTPNSPAFTANDKKAIRFLYPDYYGTPSINNVSINPNNSTTRALNFNVSYSDNSRKPLRIKVQRLPPWASNSPVLEEQVFSCSVESFSWISPLGDYNFKIIASNYNEDYEIASSTYFASVQ